MGIGYWFNFLGYGALELVAVGIAMAMLSATARPTLARRLGLIGLGLMLAAASLGLLASFAQGLSMAKGGIPGDYVWFLGVGRLLLNLLSLAGLLVVVSALCRATREGGAQ